MKDKVGAVATLLASLCCLGWPIVLAPLAALGLSFLLRDAILLPSVALFSLITLWGLYEGKKRHGRRAPLLLALPAALLLIPSFFLSLYLTILCLLLLLAATTWNTLAKN